MVVVKVSENTGVIVVLGIEDDEARAMVLRSVLVEVI